MASSPKLPRRFAVVHPGDARSQGAGRRTDAIAAYSRCLTTALSAHPAEQATLITKQEGAWSEAPPVGESSAADLARAVAGADAVLLQYNPFSYGRRGFAPWLPVVLRRARRGPRRPWIGLIVHEAYMPFGRPRQTAMALWQRAQLRAVLSPVDVVFGATETLVGELERLRPRRPSVHLPVASNLPDLRDDRTHERSALGLTPETVVLAAFGTAHAARLPGHFTAALNRVAATGLPAVFMNLGTGAPAPVGIDPHVRVEQPGELDEQALSRALAASDIFLAAYADGVSTRRGTFMSALQHQVSVVATDGPNTDELLRRAGRALTLVPVHSSDRFADEVEKLALSGPDRQTRGRNGRLLYENAFDWPIIARTIVDAVK